MSSSVCFMLVSTMPFMALFIYFIYAAYERPQKLLDAANNQNQGDQQDLEFIPLMDMLHTALLSLVAWVWFATYTGIFVRKRRRLMKSYNKDVVKVSQIHEKEAHGSIEIVGNVFYDRPKGIFFKILDKIAYTDLAYVVYRHPDGDDEDGNPRFVQKKIRTYHPYHRENVSVLILNGLPLSGQPKLDVDRDIASYQSEYAIRNRDKICQVVSVSIGWSIFLIATAIFIIFQIDAVYNLNIVREDEPENPAVAWKYFAVYTCGIIPFLAGICNFIQWNMYHRWVTKGGKVTSHPTKLVPKTLEREDFMNENEAQRYVAMA